MTGQALCSINQSKTKQYFQFMFLAVFSLIALWSLPVSAKESSVLEAAVNVDNQPIETEYILKDGRMMVPALFFKHTGTYVDWNEQYDSIVFRLNNLIVSNPAGSPYIDVKTHESGQWIREEWPVPSVNVDNKTYVPLVELGERLGLDVSYDGSTQQTSIINPQLKQGKRIGSGGPEGKQVALTFDDGPDSVYTSQILDILRDKGVPATFFVVGRQVEEYPELMAQIVREGHGLGNHTMTHPDFTTIQSSDVKKEVEQTQETIVNSVDRLPDLFRPPYGALTRADEEWLHEKGYRIITWSVDTLDWTGVSAEEILSTVRANISPGGIILQHNIDVNPGMLDGSVEALPQIIDELTSQGYTFVTVQTMLEESS